MASQTMSASKAEAAIAFALSAPDEEAREGVRSYRSKYGTRPMPVEGERAMVTFLSLRHRRDGSTVEVAEQISGWVDRVYSNGQFVLTTGEHNDPTRLELASVLTYKVAS